MKLLTLLMMTAVNDVVFSIFLGLRYVRHMHQLHIVGNKYFYINVTFLLLRFFI